MAVTLDMIAGTLAATQPEAAAIILGAARAYVAESPIVARLFSLIVTEALGEERALFSREGTAGVRQVDVTGLVAASFTHRDSRAGDPDLHTHVANKVRTLQGRWLSIGGRVLHAAATAISETCNTALETRLTHQIGVRFADPPSRDRSKRPVREIVGLDPALLGRWSSRRRAIDVRSAELAAADHGRAPSRFRSVRVLDSDVEAKAPVRALPTTARHGSSGLTTEVRKIKAGDHTEGDLARSAAGSNPFSRGLELLLRSIQTCADKAFHLSGWRDLNSRPLDPQSSAIRSPKVVLVRLPWSDGNLN